MDRELALEILVSYERNHAYLNIELNKTLKQNYPQNIKDRVTVLVYGTIQHRLFLAYQLEPFIQGKRVKVMERMLLLMSLYEHYYMHSQDYAIVSEAVRIIKKNRGKKAGSFINAVLRKALSSERPLDDLDEISYLSIFYSYPKWLVKMFAAQYGKETTRKILEAGNQPPRKTARVNTLKIDRQTFLETHPDFQQGVLSDTAVYYEGGNIAYTDAYREGLITIQDEASQLVSSFLAPEPGSSVVDLCAAPGSKTTHLAAIMKNQGTIDAYDLYEHKIGLLKENASRLGARIIDAHVGDASQIETFHDKKYDYVLLDGPCSGLGVMSRKPEIRYQDSSMMDEIIDLQKKLLENAYLLCQKSGKIVYSTCTLNKKENERQIAHFLKKHPDVTLVEEKTILPYIAHSDGFYMCLLKK